MKNFTNLIRIVCAITFLFSVTPVGFAKSDNAQSQNKQAAYGQTKNSVALTTPTPSGLTLQQVIETSLTRFYSEYTLVFTPVAEERLNIVFTNLPEVVSSVQIIAWDKAHPQAANAVDFNAPFLTIVEEGIEIKSIYSNFDFTALQNSLQSAGDTIALPNPENGNFIVKVKGEEFTADFAAFTEKLVEEKTVKNERYAVGKITDKPLPYLAGGVATEVKNLSKREANYVTLIGNVTRWMAPYQPGHPTYEYLLAQKTLYEAEKAKCRNRIDEIFDGVNYYRFRTVETVVPFFDDAIDEAKRQAGEIVMGLHKGEMVVAQGKKFQRVKKAGAAVNANGCHYFTNPMVWIKNPNVDSNGCMNK